MLQTILRPIWFGVLVIGAMLMSPEGRESLGVFVPVLLQGTWITVQLTLGGCALAIVAALVSALGKMYAPLPLRWLAIVYIEVFRGTSALVQLFWIFFVLPHFGLSLEPLEAGILALGLNLGAYGAEVVRGAIQSVPKGQWEATVALNMTAVDAMRRVILPQAVVAMIPPWGNLFIELLKATSLVSLITLADLTFKARQLDQATFQTVEVFNLVLLFYLVLATVITVVMRLLERRASFGLGRGRAG